MIISKLIKLLEDVKAIEGDVNISTYDPEHGDWEVDMVLKCAFRDDDSVILSNYQQPTGYLRFDDSDWLTKREARKRRLE